MAGTGEFTVADLAKSSPSPARPCTAPSNATSPPSHANSQSTDQQLPHHIRPIFLECYGNPMKQIEDAAEEVHRHVHRAAGHAGDGDYPRAHAEAEQAQGAARRLKELLGTAAAQPDRTAR